MAAENPIDFNKYITGEEALKTAARSVRSLKNDVSALSKSVDDDAGRIKAGFERIAAAIKELQGNGGRLSLATDADKKLLQDYIKQVGDLKKAKEDLRATEKAQADLQRGLSDATRQYTAELAKQKDALKAATLAGDEAGQRKAAAAIRQTTLETAQLSKALRGVNSEFTAAKGSYDGLVIENNKLLASLHALEGGLNSGSQEAFKLKKQIFDNTETLKIFDLETNRAFRSVGDYAKGFSGLVSELAKARAGQAGLTQGSEEYNRAQIRITGFQTAAQKSAAQMGLSYEQAEARINGVTAAVQPLATALVRLEKEQEAVAQGAGKDSEAYRKIGFQIESTKKEIDTIATATAAATDKSGAFTEQLGLNRAGLTQFAAGLAAGAIGFQAILSGAEAVFRANVVLSDSLADVRKTTGLTADETDRLVESLKGLDTRTSLSGLLDIAKVAGQLGIAKGDIFEFTKAVDIGVQALGDDFGGGAEQIATELGKISSVFRKELGPDVAQNLLAIGSAVNQIGADGAATAPFLTDVALRVGAISAQTGVGLKNVLAYAAVLQETGFNAETSGTALNKLFNTLSTKTTEAYRIARNADPSLTLKEFTRLVNTDFNAAIQAFLKGLNAGGKTTTALAGELSTLKLKGGEAQSVIVTLAQNTDLFAQRQQTANDQLRDATSLAAEAAIKNDTLAGSVNKLTNDVGNFFTSGSAGRFLKFFVDFARQIGPLVLKSGPIALLIEYNNHLLEGANSLGQRFGLAKKPLEDYTVAVVAGAKEALRQAEAQQKQLDAFVVLGKANGDALEFEKSRAALVKQFGTEDAAVIQARIDARRKEVDSTRQGLQDQLGLYDGYVAEAKKKAAGLQRSLTDNPNQQGRGLVAVELTKAEQDLAEQQRIRANILAAIAKLQPVVTKATGEGADADREAADAVETLDLASVQAAKNQVQRRKDELAANERRIAELKAYMAEQKRLFEEGQVTPEVAKEAAAGAQDLLTQLQRDGEGTRIKLARAERDEKLAIAENDRVRQGNKKNITEAELTALQREYKQKRIGILQGEVREIAKIQEEEATKRGATEPLNFIAPLDTKSLQKEMDKADKVIKRSIDNSEKQVDEAGNRYGSALEKEVKAKEVAENKKRFLQQQTYELAGTLGDAFFTFQQGRLDAQSAAEDANYQRALKTAGDNTELREKIEEDHQLKLAKIRRKEAEQQRTQALFTVALNTAQAVTSVLSTGGGTRYADFGISAGVLSAIVIAQGLAQTAAILARPLPEFFQGRRGGAPVPLATVAERGPELIHEKATNRYRYVETPSFTSLGAGDSVFTAAETARIMAGAADDAHSLRLPMQADATMRSATAAIQAGRIEHAPNKALLANTAKMDEMVRAVKGLKQVTVNVHGEVAGASIRQGSSLTQSMNQRLMNYGD